MKHTIRPAMTKFGATIALALLAIGTAACSEEAEVAVETAPEAPAGISISDGRLSLPAVGGNPGSVYFTLANDSGKDVMVRAAHMAGASSAIMHQTATWNLKTDMQEILQHQIKAGENAVFEPGGLHVMVTDLEDTLVVGGTTEVTLTFVGGDKISFDAEIRAAGDES